MIRKERKLLITFSTTADAMAMERICREEGVAGRLIPVPREISAGCGLAWCAPVSHRDVVEAFLQKQGISREGIQECLI